MAKRLFQVPQITPKEERRILKVRRHGLRGKVRCLGMPPYASKKRAS